MTFTVTYRAKDGALREECVEAASRAECAAEFRRRGIAPKGIKEGRSGKSAPKRAATVGSPRRGDRPGRPARFSSAGAAALVAAISVLLLILAGGAWWWFAARSGGRASPRAAITGEAALVAANSSPRHQIYGDPAVMEAFGRGDFGDALPREGDRLLAVFAQPGRHMCAKGASTRNLAPSAAAAFEAYASHELAAERDIAILDADPREVRELKQIVNGMREEMREYLANGNGTPRSYWRRLNERTSSEMQIYERTRRELEGEKSPEVWDEKNAALRRLGLRTIPNPNE